MRKLQALLMVALMAVGCAQTSGPVLEAPVLLAPVSPGWRQISLGDSRAVAAEPRFDPLLDRLAAEIAQLAVEERGAGATTTDEVWLTLIDLRDARDPRMGSWQGADPVYPASVVKLCYMVTAYDQQATGQLAIDGQLEEHLRLMIVRSNNVSTNAVLDAIANTRYGGDLDPPGLTAFRSKRAVSHRHMLALGLDGLYPVNKTFDEQTPFMGRDVQVLGERKGDNYEGSNMMTTGDTARLLYLLWRRALVSREASEAMLGLMRRGADSQTIFSRMVPEGVTMYSKDGFAGPARHDAAIFELPEGGAIIVVAFSKFRLSREQRAAGERAPQVIERIAELALERLRAMPATLDQLPSDIGLPATE
jgi:hypothetical protein